LLPGLLPALLAPPESGVAPLRRLLCLPQEQPRLVPGARLPGGRAAALLLHPRNPSAAPGRAGLPPRLRRRLRRPLGAGRAGPLPEGPPRGPRASPAHSRVRLLETIGDPPAARGPGGGGGAAAGPRLQPGPELREDRPGLPVAEE